MPRLIPWFAVALASNRTAQAWWIWAPLLVLTLGESALRPLLGFIPSAVVTFLCLAFSSLVFGVAGLWLLAGHLGHRLRFVAFLKMLGVVMGISVLAYLARADWDAPAEGGGFLIFLGICVLIAVAGLSLAGWSCRRHYRPFALSLWLATFLTALWGLVISPFCLLAMAAGNSGDSTAHELNLPDGREQPQSLREIRPDRSSSKPSFICPRGKLYAAATSRFVPQPQQADLGKSTIPTSARLVPRRAIRNVFCGSDFRH